MKLIAPLAIAALVAACAASPSGNDLTRRSAVVVDGQTYDIGQLTESTWTALPRAGSSNISSAATGSAHKGAVLQAIERASGCKVTDSDYSPEGRQLDAQVDCAGRLKN
jgi:hypothetical protein